MLSGSDTLPVLLATGCFPIVETVVSGERERNKYLLQRVSSKIGKSLVEPGIDQRPVLKSCTLTPRPGGSVVGVSDSGPGSCEFETRLRQNFFPANFRLSRLLEHVSKVVGCFRKKYVLVLV